MTQVVIVVDADGVYEGTLTDSEIDHRVLKRGENDREIEAAESKLETIEA